MTLDLSKIKKVFFVGVGGIGISAIARMMLLEGKEVFGSDMSEGQITHELIEHGAKISFGQSFELIPKDADLIVYTTAIKHYDPKLMEQIFNSGITAKSYPEMLSVVTDGKYTIAVSGTHGKTTTTAMIAKILMDADKDPSVIVGSLLKEHKSNLIVGKSEYFVVEACEYERSFLNIKPKILVITNIEADHLDYYKDIEDIKKAFSEMVLQTGDVVVCSTEIIEQLGLEKSGLKIIDYIKYLDSVPSMKVPGKHNRIDAAAAMAVSSIIGITEDSAQKSLSNFQGTWRRLELKGTTNKGVIVYDDYAHHPTEIKASLQALRELYKKGEKKITVLFQPHLYSRTKALFEEFTTAFNEADNVYLLPIFFAREEPDPTISSEILANAISKNVANTRSFSSFEEAEQFFHKLSLTEGDIFVTMGAGQAYKVGDNLMK